MITSKDNNKPNSELPVNQHVKHMPSCEFCRHNISCSNIHNILTIIERKQETNAFSAELSDRIRNWQTTLHNLGYAFESKDNLQRKQCVLAQIEDTEKAQQLVDRGLKLIAEMQSENKNSLIIS